MDRINSLKNTLSKIGSDKNHSSKIPAGSEYSAANNKENEQQSFVEYEEKVEKQVLNTNSYLSGRSYLRKNSYLGEN